MPLMGLYGLDVNPSIFRKFLMLSFLGCVFHRKTNIEFYKCHNYGHIARNCRSMIRYPMKEKVYERHKKVWRRSEEKRRR
jgi:hypothetical protein